ncbi:MAG: hypothetical protein IPF54_23855 [Draconibacterium sp.]|nr:hypothetical protein [Draconibacterium sp.]
MRVFNPYNLKLIKHIIPKMRLAIGLLVFIIILLSIKVYAVEEIIDIKLDPVVSFDEVPVGLLQPLPEV